MINRRIATAFRTVRRRLRVEFCESCAQVCDGACRARGRRSRAQVAASYVGPRG